MRRGCPGERGSRQYGNRARRKPRNIRPITNLATQRYSIRAHAAEIQAHFSHVFNEESTLRTMTEKPMVIELIPDAEPFAVTTARPLPYSWREYQETARRPPC